MSYQRKSINEIKRPMNNDYLEVENADGMPGLIDSTVALEFLLSVKTDIRTAAIVLTEVENSETRSTICNFLNKSIDLHAELTKLLIDKRWLHPYDINEQVKLDNISAETAVKIANLDLFPGDTSRLGTFATPNY